MPVNLDLSKLSHRVVLPALLPLLPGGSLVIGTLLLRPTILSGHFQLTVNSYERFGLISFFAYALGFALVLINDAVASLIAAPLIAAVSRRLLDTSRLDAPWRDAVLQRLVVEFLPPGLAPKSEAGLDLGLFKDLIEKVKSTDEATSISAVTLLRDGYLRSAVADATWRSWYKALSVYASMRHRNITVDSAYFMSTLQTLGVVGLILLTIGGVTTFLAWTACVFATLYGIFYTTGYRLSIGPLDSSTLSAILLAEIKSSAESVKDKV